MLPDQLLVRVRPCHIPHGKGRDEGQTVRIVVKLSLSADEGVFGASKKVCLPYGIESRATPGC